MKGQANQAQLRRAQIVSMSLTELMLLLVFMAIAFSFLARDEGRKEVPKLQADLNVQLRINAALRKENAKLKSEKQELERFLKRLNLEGATLLPDGKILMPNGDVWVRSNGRAAGNPSCALRSTYLIEFSLLSDNQMRGRRLWLDDDNGFLDNLPGIGVLTSGQLLSLDQFNSAAGELKSAILARSKCVFAAKAIRQTKDADAFDAELIRLEQYFNVYHR